MASPDRRLIDTAGKREEVADGVPQGSALEPFEVATAVTAESEMRSSGRFPFSCKEVLLVRLEIWDEFGAP